MTVNGPVPPSEMGITLTHEHVLVDFIGADSISYERWNKIGAAQAILPYLLKAKEAGTVTFVECTPAYIGRDPVLLKMLSVESGLKILTNTGYYGASDNKFIPGHAWKESPDELSARWINEWKRGIEGTGVKPGFIKIGVMSGDLSNLHRNLVTAAARTHLATGLTIASHTGQAIPAFAQMGVLCSEGVSPEAFIWVHAQSEKNLSSHVMAAQCGAWVSFDGISDDNTDQYVKMIRNMKENNCLDHVLLSHDAGWYRPAQKGGGEYRGYTALFEKLIPGLKKEGFSDAEINQLIVDNPALAFTVRIRRME
ncbi:MAG TPA: hypothetical protein VK207_07910 [Bacteroidales bacterium]|nr:hypothetical protein [Bacteroidales bacterium]